MEKVLELLRPLKAPRLTLSYWPSTGTWGLYIFEGGKQLFGADEPTIDMAVAAVVEQSQPGEDLF